ncbi:MAG: 2-isopropylmalate synthase, partial [Myxococcota bacterium]
MTRIQVMDTTLRDGEQTPEVSYAPEEKLQVAKMLLSDVGVDRIEVAGTRVSEGEREAARRICRWAKRTKALDRVEMLGYCDGDLSPAWLAETGGRVLNLLVKGSEKHCREQLGMSPEQHRRKVAQTVTAAKKRRLVLNAYLEDWSQGVRGSPEYVFQMTRQLVELGVKRVYLADTLGVQSPEEASRTVDLMVSSFPDAHFEYHCHNDYGLANANCLAAVNAGARGVHTSVNGLGERAGNTRLAEVVAVLHDHGRFTTGVNERRLAGISRLIETMSGKDIAANAPIVGADV